MNQIDLDPKTHNFQHERKYFKILESDDFLLRPVKKEMKTMVFFTSYFDFLVLIESNLGY